MKSTILIIENSIGFTGALKAALKEADLLSDNYRFVFVVPSRSSAKKIIAEKGYTLYDLPFREISRSPVNLLLYFPTLLLNYFRLHKIVKKEQCHYIQVNDFYNLLGAMMKFFGWKGKLITYVRFLPYAMPGLLRKIWTKMAQRYSYKVIAVSDAVLKQLPARSNTIRIYDPVSFEEKNIVAAPGTDTISFLYLANFTRGKGQEHAINAFASAFQQNKNIRLHFYGGVMGLAKNKAFRAELATAVIDAGLGKVVSINDFADDVETVIKNSDAVLNFSEAESFSMTCAEASYYGRPVIATRSGGPEEIVEDSVSGFLVDKGDTTAMAERILLLASSGELREKQGIAGKNKIRQQFSDEQFLLAIKDVLV